MQKKQHAPAHRRTDLDIGGERSSDLVSSAVHAFPCFNNTVTIVCAHPPYGSGGCNGFPPFSLFLTKISIAVNAGIVNNCHRL